MSKVRCGLSWVYLGLLQTTILRPVGNVDPVEENNVKVCYLKEEVSAVSSTKRLDNVRNIQLEIYQATPKRHTDVGHESIFINETQNCP